MNKKVLKVAFMAAISMLSGVNVFNAQKSETLSDIALANVEALAGGEENWIGSNCWCVAQYTICDYEGYYQGCPCGSKG